MFDIIIALFDLVIHGDYTPALHALGWAEDHPAVDFTLTSTGR